MKTNSFRLKLSRFFFLLFASNIFFFTCNSSEKTSSEKEVKTKSTSKNSKSLFPLSVGNKWEYFNESPKIKSVPITVEVLSQKDNEFILSAFPFFPGFDDPVRETKITIDTGGVLKITLFDGSKTTFLPDTTYLDITKNWNCGVFVGYVSELKDSVKTEAGKFSGGYYIMFTEGFTFSIEMWLIPGVGIVRWGVNRTNPPTPIANYKYYALRKYSVN